MFSQPREEWDKSDGKDDVMVCENGLGMWDGEVLNQSSKSSSSRRNSYLNRGAGGVVTLENSMDSLRPMVRAGQSVYYLISAKAAKCNPEIFK